MFNVNWLNIIINILPPGLRFNPFTDFIYASLAGLRDLYDQFIAYREDTLDKLAYNSQIIYLTYILNKKFTGGLTTIYIEDAVMIEQEYIYRTTELHDPIYIYRVGETITEETYVYRNSDYESEYDFIVYVPNTLVFDENEMKATVEFYKLAGKRFKIETYIL